MGSLGPHARRPYENIACTLQYLHTAGSLSSVHTPQGYGTGSLDRDADDLSALAAHLGARARVRGVALLGHSTGCQDIVRYVARHGPGARRAAARGSDTAAATYPDLLATVLQAPVGAGSRGRCSNSRQAGQC